jgi:hypothetical protein
VRSWPMVWPMPVSSALATPRPSPFRSRKP